MKVSLNALGLNALRSQAIATQSSPDDLPLEQLFAAAMIAAANTVMLVQRRKQLEEGRQEDVLPHYFFRFPAGIVAQSVLNLAVCAYQHVGWPHTRIVGDTLVIAREPYEVLAGRGEFQACLPFVAESVTDAGGQNDDLLIGHHGGGYSQSPIAAG